MIWPRSPGEAGTRHAMDTLSDELRTAMALVGAATIDELRPAVVRKGAFGAAP